MPNFFGMFDTPISDDEDKVPESTIANPRLGGPSSDPSAYANSPFIPDSSFMQGQAYKNVGDEISQAPNRSMTDASADTEALSQVLAGRGKGDISSLVQNAVKKRIPQKPMMRQAAPTVPMASSPISAPVAVPPADPSGAPSMRMPSSMPDDIGNLPNSYDEGEGKMDQYRAGLNQSNAMINMGQALSHMARGTHEPVSMDPLFSNMNSQNNAITHTYDNDANRRAQIIKAVQDRQYQSALNQQGLQNNKELLNQRFLNDQKLQDRSNQNKKELLGQRIQGAQDLKSKGKDGAPANAPKVRMSDYNNTQRALQGIDSGQHVWDTIYNAHPDKFGSDTGYLGKAKSFFGMSNGDTEQQRSDIAAMKLPIAKAMAGGASPTDQMLKSVGEMLPSIDEQQSPQARAKSNSMMSKLFADAEPYVSSLEAAHDPQAPAFREQLEAKKKAYQEKIQTTQGAAPGPSQQKVKAGGKDYLLGNDGRSLFNLDGSPATK